MPKPESQLKFSRGEKVRITEKEKYKAMANSDFLDNLVTEVNNIPRKAYDGKQISEKANQCLDMLVVELPKLKTEWKTYTEAYSNVDKNAVEMNKEAKSAAIFFTHLRTCMERIEELNEDDIHLEPHFAKVRSELKNVYGHYQEMQFGSLDMSKQSQAAQAQAKVVSEDPEIMSEGMWMKFIEDVNGSKNKRTMIEYKYVDRSDEPLFPHEPSPDDIVQGGLGDCFFVATLSAICAANPHIIRSLMKDNGKTVTVPVWEVDDDGKILPPKFVTVTKNVPAKVTQRPAENGKIRTTTEYLFGKTALWVQMMEKAYAASGIHNKAYKKQDTKRNYEEITKGYGMAAVKAILGPMTKTTTVFAHHPEAGCLNLRDPEELYEYVKKSVHDNNILIAGCGAGTDISKQMKRFKEESKAAIEDNRINNRGKSELQIKKNIADKVFHGLTLDYDRDGNPSLSSHEYAVTNAYEENGKKYIVVRNPNALRGQDPNSPKSFDWAQNGYSAIPAEEFRSHFHTLISSKPMIAMERKDHAENFKLFTFTCYDAVKNTLSRWENTFGDWAMSEEFNQFYSALQEVSYVCATDCTSDYSLSKAFENLSLAAENYLDKKGNDTEKDDVRNIRTSVAKACIALASSYKMKDHPEKVMDTQKLAAEMMVADRTAFYIHNAQRTGQLPPDKMPIRGNPKFSKLLSGMDTAQLLNVALKTKLSKLPDVLQNAINEQKAAKNAPQNVEQINNAENRKTDKNPLRKL